MFTSWLIRGFPTTTFSHRIWFATKYWYAYVYWFCSLKYNIIQLAEASEILSKIIQVDAVM